MRAIVRYGFFVLSVIGLGIVGLPCAATWTRAYVRMEQDEREVKLFMSHRGQMRWFSYRVFDEPWKISKAAPSADGGSLQLDLSGPSEVISSSANVVSISNSGAMLRRSL